MKIKNRPFFCSWSGGKDSCLALYYALQEGGIPKQLLTMFNEEGIRSRSHGLSLPLLQKQAEALGIPLTAAAATWEDYEAEFINKLQQLKASGIEVGVYGDIDLEQHRAWVEQVSKQAGMLVYHPLWQKPRLQVLNEFLAAGFKAVVVSLDGSRLDKKYLGRVVDQQLLQEFVQAGIDPAGENGEYHTVVIGGPIFKSELPIILEEQQKHGNYWFQSVALI
ncbi:MAG TPA: adenosine nucleotide hydrolase [Firmicutes bacterium]|jgi:diphthine-ammonia ligase|nr:diphthine--ammonia ligase [Bacillota bacterium]HAA38138.1 adenosine nucleotide hydrolase [Bacillota bacterium]